MGVEIVITGIVLAMNINWCLRIDIKTYLLILATKF